MKKLNLPRCLIGNDYADRGKYGRKAKALFKEYSFHKVFNSLRVLDIFENAGLSRPTGKNIIYEKLRFSKDS